MKIITSRLYGLIYLAIVGISAGVEAAEFTCDAEGFNCLSDAVTAANQTKGPDTIRFSEGGHIVFGPPERCAPAIVGKITIVGAGSAATSLEAQGSCAFFHVKPGSSLTLRDITVSSGNLVGRRAPGEIQRGAAVLNEGHLRVERSVFRGNGINESDVFLSGGGAIYNAPKAKAYITDTDFLYNSVRQENYGGAAILNEGVMTVAHSRFFENGGRGGIIVNGIKGSSATASLVLLDSIINKNFISTAIRNDARLLVEGTTVRDGDAAEGGGIYNGGELTVRESAILRNKAIRGAGVYNAEDATSTFINTTISKNHARGRLEGNGIGGGVFNFGGTVYLANSTIAENTAQGSGAAIAATSDADGSAFFYVKRSLILGHSNNQLDQSCHDFGPNDLPKFFLQGDNLITEESNCYHLETDIVVKEATTFTQVIGPLASHGGPTPSYALLPGSPAIDAEGTLCTDFEGMPIVIDQRGKVRTGCDIGAVDSTGTTPPVVIKLKLPGSPPAIQPNSTGTFDLGIVSRVDSIKSFRPVWDINRNSVRLGAAGAVPLLFLSQDINADGIADLVMRFKTSETGIACGDKTLELRGAIIAGAEFVSRTAIKTIGCSVN